MSSSLHIPLSLERRKERGESSLIGREAAVETGERDEVHNLSEPTLDAPKYSYLVRYV